MTIDVMMADDHGVIRDGIRAILERKAQDINLVFDAGNGRTLLQQAKKKPADVYLLDISMPLLNGLETMSQLIKMDRASKVIILSMYDGETSVEKALRGGARGYILKQNAAEEVILGIREVYSGKFYLSPTIAHHVIKGFLDSNSPSSIDAGAKNRLSAKEREVLQLLAEGHSTKEIAKHLDISANTIHVHRYHIMKKLDIHKQADLVRYAIKEGLSQI